MYVINDDELWTFLLDMDYILIYHIAEINAKTVSLQGASKGKTRAKAKPNLHYPQRWGNVLKKKGNITSIIWK